MPPSSDTARAQCSLLVAAASGPKRNRLPRRAATTIGRASAKPAPSHRAAGRCSGGRSAQVRKRCASEDYWSALPSRFLWQNRQNRQMKKTLPHFALLVATALCGAARAQTTQSTAAASASTPLGSQPIAAPNRTAPGDELLVKTSDQLARRASIAARLQYDVAVGGEELKGFGSYWQQGSGEDLKVRLELTIARETRLLQVSNGRFLWIDRRLPAARTVTRVDLRQLRADPALAPPDFDKLDPGKANWAAVQPLLTGHAGGLPNLLESLRENFVFLPPQAMQLEMEQPNGAAPMKMSVFAVVGQWKSERLKTLLAKNEDAPTD